jgi:hypothetical protein
MQKTLTKWVKNECHNLATVLSGLSQVTQSLSFLCNEPDDNDDENDKRSEAEYPDVTNTGKSNIICSESDS